MPALLVDHGPPDIGGEAVEIIRDTLHRLPEKDRPKLWANLERFQHAVFTGREAALFEAVDTAPDGPVRRCLMRLARTHWGGVHAAEVRRQYQQVTELLALHRPAYIGAAGTVCPTRTWSNGSGFVWQSVEPGAFDDHVTTWKEHRPVPLRWRHGDTVLGMTRLWELDHDGTLGARFLIGAAPEAQRAATMAAKGWLGLSVGVRFVDSTWSCWAPDEWDPIDGRLDFVTHPRALVEEVSLTPSPVFDNATITAVW